MHGFGYNVAWCDFAVDALSLLLSAQLCQFAGNAFVMTCGSIMGLSCASQCGNIFLAAMDSFVGNALRLNILGYKRYSDDCLLITDRKLDNSFIDRVFNSWRPEIGCTVCEGPSTAYLDLNIHFDGSVTSFSTHRKQLAQYFYVPFNSCHSVACKKAIIAGEAIKLLRTNSSAVDYNRNIDLFRDKLRLMGYPPRFVDAQLASKNWEGRNSFVDIAPRGRDERFIVPFNLKYFCAAELFGFSQAIRENLYMLGDFRDNIKVTMCFMTFPNLFRLRYSRFFCEPG